MCSGLKLGPLIWKESSRRGLASIPDENECRLNVVNCMKLDLSGSNCGRFLEGEKKTHYDRWRSQVDLACVLERKSPSRGQSIPQPTGFWNPLCVCRHSCETLGEQFQPADSYLHLFLTFKSKSFTKGGLWELKMSTNWLWIAIVAH